MKGIFFFTLSLILSRSQIRMTDYLFFFLNFLLFSPEVKIRAARIIIFLIFTSISIFFMKFLLLSPEVKISETTSRELESHHLALSSHHRHLSKPLSLLLFLLKTVPFLIQVSGHFTVCCLCFPLLSTSAAMICRIVRGHTRF